MEIEIDIFAPATIELAMFKLKKYQEDLNRNFDFILNEACEEAETVAKAEYAKGAEDGNTDVKVTLTKEGDKSYLLEASGNDVFFLEYGTGDFANLGEQGAVSPWQGSMLHDFFMENTDVPFFSPGSWSKDHQMQYTMYGRWWHDGKEYKGTVPHRGMNEAIKALRRKRRTLLKDLFST